MKKLIYTIFILLSCTQLYACNKDKESNIPNQESMKLKITIGKNTAMAILYDNPTSRDFVTLLPQKTL